MLTTAWNLAERLLTTPYHPQPEQRGFLDRAETLIQADVEVTVAIPSGRECEKLFGIPVASRGLQPLYLRVQNRGTRTLRLQVRSIDPRYFTPLEAAARCHFSILKRLSAFGVLGWLISPLLMLIPLKLLTAHLANFRMDACFQEQGFHRRPIGPGETAEGFVYTTLDAGTKVVRVWLAALSVSRPVLADHAQSANTPVSETPEFSNSASRVDDIDLTFTLSVPNLAVDYEHQELAERSRTGTFEDCHVPELVERLRAVPTVTTNRSGRGTGDPVNLVVIGSFETLLVAFVGRWDETETITLKSCWKTVRAFLFGTEYRYSPVTPLYLFGRSQDLALQQIRHSINVRIHLRLWLSPYRLHGQPVWIGQISRDIGVRFTLKTWNLTTHRIDPDIDESRDYVLEDLLDAERVEAAAHVIATTSTAANEPRRNLTGDPYETDGRRVVIKLSDHRTHPRFVEWT